ncbi:hypothetical protein [Niallia sp. FSL W8-0954]|uniref:hypothetical protein n=1 Tax=Niallia sp. FSL W8-0954 TaxID=2975338 RepID=UPI0030F78D77
MERESAKLLKYQPKWRGNQPTSENISQSGGRISQTSNLNLYRPIPTTKKHHSIKTIKVVQ